MTPQRLQSSILVLAAASVLVSASVGGLEQAKSHAGQPMSRRVFLPGDAGRVTAQWWASFDFTVFNGSALMRERAKVPSFHLSGGKRNWLALAPGGAPGCRTGIAQRYDFSNKTMFPGKRKDCVLMGKNKYCYVHVWKAGGTTVNFFNVWLVESEHVHHDVPGEAELCGLDKIDDLYRRGRWTIGGEPIYLTTAVRDPVERFISGLREIELRGDVPTSWKRAVAAPRARRASKLTLMLEHMMKTSYLEWDHHLHPQFFFLCAATDTGDVIRFPLDHIGRTEFLDFTILDSAYKLYDNTPPKRLFRLMNTSKRLTQRSKSPVSLNETEANEYWPTPLDVWRICLLFGEDYIAFLLAVPRVCDPLFAGVPMLAKHPLVLARSLESQAIWNRRLRTRDSLDISHSSDSNNGPT